MSTTSLKIVKPVTITQSMLVSTNVPENDYAEWTNSTTYALGSRVISTPNSKIYESLQAANLNHAVSDPLWWIEVSPTNRWKLFDTSNSTQTSKAGTITYVINTGTPVTALALLNLTNAIQVHINATHPTYGVLYDQTFIISPQPAAPTWWDWFFGTRRDVRQKVLLDLQAVPDTEITIELEGGDNLALGVLLVGQAESFGTGVKYGAKLGIQDYSRKETNDFGDTVLVRRAYSKRASFDMWVPNNEVDTLQNILTDVRATPCLWVGTDEFEATVVFGIYRQFDIIISYPTFSDCQLELEGLT